MGQTQMQQYYARNEHSNVGTTSRGVHEVEEIVPGVPIIRSNTPRPLALDARISSAGYRHQRNGSLEIEIGKGRIPRDFPVWAPSASPLPEGFEHGIDATACRGGSGGKLHSISLLPQSQPQILGLSFADVAVETEAVRTGQAQGPAPVTTPQKPTHGSGDRSGAHKGCQDSHIRQGLLQSPLSQRAPTMEQDQKVSSTQTRGQRWLVAFSLYLVGVLLVLLLLTVAQGVGITSGTAEGGLAPLGVPWQVLVCGLLGGCISCMVSLSNIGTFDPPLFVMITWFTRPFIGSLLALFSYILLTSGIFTLGGSVDQHPGFFWLIGLLAGLCEWWLFSKRKKPNP